MKFAKHLPNILTCIRIAASVSILFIDPLSDIGWLFFAVYAAAGVSDVLDGVIARGIKATSVLGSRLDSAADLVFYSAMIIRLLPIFIDAFQLWVWCVCGAAFLIRLVSYIVAAIKYKRFASLHTYLNKATGFLVFIVPFMLFNGALMSGFAGAAAIFSAVGSTEELLIHIFTREYDPQNKTLFVLFGKKEN